MSQKNDSAMATTNPGGSAATGPSGPAATTSTDTAPSQGGAPPIAATTALHAPPLNP